MLNVKVLSHTPSPENVIASAARLCYSPLGINELVKKYTDEQNQKMIDKLIELKHESPLEHVSFTFAIEGVSRTLTHQLVRHRVASHSQQSQRYVRESQFKYIIPKEIRKNTLLADIFRAQMASSQEAYDVLVDRLMANGRTEKQAIEDARYVFPNATETKIITTMNVRTLLNFFELRCCNRAQWEIQQLADEMLREVRKIAPTLFAKAGASCTFGKCREGKMTCGVVRKISDYE